MLFFLLLWYNNYMKICSNCKIKKEMIKFSKNRTTKDGYNNWCKDCYKKKYKEKKDYVCEKSRLYYAEHKEKCKERFKRYRNILNNKERLKEQHKQYCSNNKERLKEQHKQYYEKNKEKIIKQVYDSKRKKLKKDVEFKLKENLRTRLNHGLKGKNKSAKTMEILGCSNKELKKYLETLFQKGMSWDNYGKWHIDHIKPCCSFDLTKKEEQLKCFNFKNLQPLWAKDNLIKGKKILN